MKRILVLAIPAALALAVPAVGDTVHMRDGRTLIGQVAEEGDKYIIKMPHGVVAIDKSRVIYVAYGTAGTGPAVATGPAADESRPADTNVRPGRRWNANAATLPEPIVFMIARQLELLGDTPEGALSRRLRQWRIAAHEGKRKSATEWLTRSQQRRRRRAFEKHLRKVSELERQIRSVRPGRSVQKVKTRNVRAKIEKEYESAAKVVPDRTMRDFLTAVLYLRHGNYDQAEQRFRMCIEDEPLAAAFHQGRGFALVGLNRPAAALAEFVICLELRDDTSDSLRLIEQAMKEVPGAEIGLPVYLKAKTLLASYERGESSQVGSRAGINWLMPGDGWRLRSGAFSRRLSGRDDVNGRPSLPDERYVLPTPPYDRIISKQALAVPISEDGTLLVDAEAIAGADLLYIRIAPNVVVRAEPIRLRTYGRKADRPDLPLALIATDRASFTPVDVARSAELPVGRAVTIRSANLYRRMGTDIRTGRAKVVAAGPDGVTLDRGLLPGEAVGVVLAEDAFAGLLTSRNRPQDEGCGKSRFIKPSDLAAWVKSVAGSSRRRYMRRRSWGRGPKLKPDVPKAVAAGRVFLVHALIGEKTPPPAMGQ